MTKHFLKRNPDNEPICACGFRPDILDAVYARWPKEAAAGAAAETKAEVAKAVAGGTALKPPAPPVPPADAAGGYSKFLASQRAGSRPQ